jgi:hypothetical protein
MRPVFIFGGDPSSKAFLSALLAAHPACVATPQFSHAYLRSARNSLFGSEPEVTELTPYTQHALSDLERPEGAAYPAFIGQLVRAYANDYGKAEAEVWLEPVETRHVSRLAETFPEGSFLQLVRDGRAVAATTWHVPGAHQTMARASRRWNHEVLEALEAGGDLGSKSYRVSYEALLSDLQPELEALASFIGIPPGSFLIPQTVLEKDYSSHLYAWRRQLPIREVKRFEETSGTVLTNLGYGLETGTVGIPARPDLWSRAGRHAPKHPGEARPLRPVHAAQSAQDIRNEAREG